ncbi:MAG: biosynthetic-type acetolactate synthase large subunit [Cyclobacteriaceae bacterium]
MALVTEKTAKKLYEHPLHHDHEAENILIKETDQIVNGSEAVILSLIEEGVDTIFGYPGGAIMPIYDALFHYRNQLNHVLVRHEQGATHAAEGYAQMAKKPGVCFATSGPGATNLVTGMADAMLDSVPIVCITGQVAEPYLGTDAFQETDVMSLAMPITKWCYQVANPDEIPYIIAKAFYIARSGRPGPVLVDITKDAQSKQMSVPFTYEKRKQIKGYKPASTPRETDIAKAAELINSAKKPFLFAGHGILLSGAQEELKTFVEKTGIPVASTLLGLSAFPSDHPLYVGMLGMHGNYGPNMLTNEADVIIAVGMRFDDRVTGNLDRYAKQAKVIHIDIDHAEIGKNVPAAVGIIADAKSALVELTTHTENRKHEAWLAEFEKHYQEEYEKVIKNDFTAEAERIKMGEVVRLLTEKTNGEAIVVADVGQHQMFAARYSKFRKTDSWLTSGGLGTMGYALPASLGAKIGSPDRSVFAIIGDGCFQMNIQELGTIKQTGQPVKIIIMNNNYLGMVRQWQQLFFDTRYSFVELENPDFITIARGYGIEGHRCNHADNLSASLDTLINAEHSYLLEIMVEKEANVFPMVPSGSGVDQIRLE